MQPNQTGNEKGPKKSESLDTLQFVFAFMAAFAGYLFASKPTTVSAAIPFRIVIFLIGVAGWIIVQILKRRNK